MNMNELREQLNTIEPELQRLNEQINQLENERKTKEQSQLVMVGDAPKPVPKSEEQVRLEQERDRLTVIKNRTRDVVSSYNQMAAQASSSEFNGYTIEDFTKMLNDFDSKRKELGNQIQVMENERKAKEQSQLRMAGDAPKPVPKSEEQVNLEREKLTYEQNFQKIANIINLYNRLKGDMENLKNEPDSLKKVTEFEKLIYQAHRAGFPEQLMVNLLDNKTVIKNVTPVQQEQIPDTKQVSNVVTSNTKQETVSSSKSREEEIYDLLDKSSQALQVAMKNGDDNAIAEERSYRGRLLNELYQLKEEEKRKAREAEIAKYETLLNESSERLKKATEENNENDIAEERSYRAQLLNKIAELKGVTLNEPTKVSTSSTEESITPIKEENESESSSDEENKEPEVIEEETETKSASAPESEPESEIESETEEETIEEDEYSQLNDEEIREKIAEIDAKRKEIDDQIIKIDLNAPWQPDADLMKEFILLGKEKEKLKTYLPEEMEDKKEVEEVIEDEPVIEENEAEKEKDEAREENTETEVAEQKATRHPKFKKFFKEVIPNTILKVGYAIKKLVSKVTDQNKEGNLYISDDLVDNRVEENNASETTETEEIIEDEDKTEDFTQSNDVNEKETPQDDVSQEESSTIDETNKENRSEIIDKLDKKKEQLKEMKGKVEEKFLEKVEEMIKQYRQNPEYAEELDKNGTNGRKL